MTTTSEVCRRVASFGLNAVDSDPGDPIFIDEEQVQQVASLLQRLRLDGLAVRAVAAGEFDAPESFAAALATCHDETMAQCLRIEIMAIRTSELLSNHGIAHRLLKGSALAHRMATLPADRPFRDVDILVRGDALDESVRQLTSAGAVRLQPQLRAGFDARFGKSVTMRLDDVEIDVHRLLCPGPFGVWMRPDDLFLLGASLSIGSVEIPTLDPTDHLLHACYHAALGSPAPALINLRDVAMLAAETTDVQRFDEAVRRWRGRAVINRAASLVESELKVQLPNGLAQYRHEPIPSDERAAIDPYLSDDQGGRFAALAPATFRALPLSDRAAYALAVGLPAGSQPVDRIRSMLTRRRR